MSDITVGSVAVDIVPDARGFAEKLKAKLRGLTAEIGLQLDTAEVRAQLEELTRPRSVTINANADTSEAEAQLDEAARTRDAGINADARGISGLVAGVLLLGPALVPIAAAIAGLTAALGAPLAAAGGGLTLFAFLAGAAISKTQKVGKQIDELKRKADTLVDPKAKAAALAQAKALEASLTGPQRAFLNVKGRLSDAFSKLLGGATGKDLFRPINQGIRLLTNLLPGLAPVIHSVSTALGDLLKSAGDSAKSGGLKSFLDFLGKASGPALSAFGTILGNIAKGFGGLIAAFAPTGAKLTGKLVALSAAFAGFGKNAGSNKGLQSFIAYVQKVGPKVASVFGDVVKAVGHLATALAPIGGLVLAGIGVFANIVSAIPTPVLAYLAGVLVTIVAGLKAWAIVQGILDAALAANPIGLVVLAIAALVGGLIAAYKSSETFRNIVQGAFHAVAAAIDFVKDHWKLLITLILGPFGAAIVFIVDHFDTVKKVAQTVFKFVVSAFLTVVGALINGAAKAFGWVPGLGPKLKAAAAKFNEFRDSVNAAIAGITPYKVIHLDVKVTGATNATIGEAAAAPRVAGATGAIVNRPTVALIGEAGPEALIPLNQTRGNAPLPGGLGGGVEHEQTMYRAFTRALNDGSMVVVSKDRLDTLDLVGSAL